MKTTSTLLLATLLALVGCSSDFPVTVHLDETWTDAEIVVIESAFQEWETATGGMMQYELVRGFSHHFDAKEDYFRDDVHVLYRLNASEMETFRVARGRDIAPVGATSNISDGIGNVIVIAIDALPTDVDLWNTMAHELGHFYGFENHVEGTLMAEAHTQQDCIDMVTVERVCEVHGCEAHPTCTR